MCQERRTKARSKGISLESVALGVWPIIGQSYAVVFNAVIATIMGCAIALGKWKADPFTNHNAKT